MIYNSKKRNPKGLTISEISKLTKLSSGTINNKNNLPFFLEKFLIVKSLKNKKRYHLSKAGFAVMGILAKQFIDHLKNAKNQTVKQILYGDEQIPSDNGCLGRDSSKRYKCIVDELKIMVPKFLEWNYTNVDKFFHTLDIFSTFTLNPKKPLNVCNGKVRLRCTGNTHRVYSKNRGKIIVQIKKPNGYLLRKIGSTRFGNQGNFDWFGNIPKKLYPGTYTFIAKYQLSGTSPTDPDVGFGKWTKKFKINSCN